MIFNKVIYLQEQLAKAREVAKIQESVKLQSRVLPIVCRFCFLKVMRLSKSLRF